jgi:acetyl esterase|tara:strand:+ start:1430 stop:2491 length:1062 start_codon:yes stop_codon:yes gene_type:complete
MNLVTLFRQKPVSVLFAILLLMSCVEHQELEANNDPAKYDLVKDVLWASPDGFDLTMDIYTPLSGKPSYPVVVMFHGGGWLINDKSIMDQAAAYLATNSNYVVCNVNYRLLSDNGNTITLNEIINDAFGSVLWVKSNIAAYKGDSTRIVVSGDSAGAHLSAMVVNMGDQLSSELFSSSSPRFTPSYLPESKSAEQVAAENGLAVQAAVLSYGAYDLSKKGISDFESMKNPFWWVSGSIARGLFGDGYNVVEYPLMYKAISPSQNIPQTSGRQLPPQLLTSGSEDPMVSPESVKSYTEMLQSAGHTAVYWEYEGKSHAFLDSGSNRLLGSSFEADAPLALNVMIEFLDEVFYPL